MTNPTLEHILELLDHRDESLVCGNMIILQDENNLSELVDVYVEAFYKLRNFVGRREIAYWVGRYVNYKDSVFKLAIHGLNDKSYMVRYHCCQILAFAQNEKALDHLYKYSDHKHAETREDVAAAIDAIKCKNHNYFVDREHTGRIFFEMGKI